MNIETYGEVLYVRLRPDDDWARSESGANSMVTVDVDRYEQLIGFETFFSYSALIANEMVRWARVSLPDLRGSACTRMGYRVEIAGLIGVGPSVANARHDLRTRIFEELEGYSRRSISAPSEAPENILVIVGDDVEAEPEDVGAADFAIRIGDHGTHSVFKGGNGSHRVKVCS